MLARPLLTLAWTSALSLAIALAGCAEDPAGSGPDAPASGPEADSGLSDARPVSGDAGAPDAAAAPVALRLVPAGRLALATGEVVPLRVLAVDASGVERDVSAAASFEVRNPEAALVTAAVLTAGALGSRATTVVASYAGLSSAPLLVSTLAPAWREDFESARRVEVTGTGFTSSGVTTDRPLAGRSSLAVTLAGRAGDRLRVTLPLASPLSMTNAERALLAYRLEGDVAGELRFGTMNGDTAFPAIEPTPLPIASGQADHASLPLNGSFFDWSWDARAVVLDLTLSRAGQGRLWIDDLRVLRQFILGANLAWLDGAYGHDFGRSFHNPTWGVAYDPRHMEEILAFCQEHGVRLLRVWVFEGCEGLVKDADEIVTGIDSTLLQSFDDFIFRLLPRYDVKVYLTLLGADHIRDCKSPSPLPAGKARDALLSSAVEPFAARYGGSRGCGDSI